MKKYHKPIIEKVILNYSTSKYGKAGASYKDCYKYNLIPAIENEKLNLTKKLNVPFNHNPERGIR